MFCWKNATFKFQNIPKISQAAASFLDIFKEEFSNGDLNIFLDPSVVFCKFVIDVDVKNLGIFCFLDFQTSKFVAVEDFFHFFTVITYQYFKK